MRLSHVCAGRLMLLCVAIGLACGPLQAAEPFDYFRNSYSLIGLKDYASGTRVTPDNVLLLANEVQIQIRYGKQLQALSRQHTKTLLEGWLPAVALSASEGPIRYEFTLWTSPLPTVKDWQRAFDWPTEGENYVNWILVKAVNSTAEPAQAVVKVEERGKSASTSQDLIWPLAPHATAERSLAIPFMPLEDRGTLAKEDARLWLRRTVNYWKRIVGKAAHRGSLPQGDAGPAGGPCLAVDHQRPRRAARGRRIL